MEPEPATGALLAVNVLGSALLGLLVGSTTVRHSAWRHFAGTGVLGGFTTFSAAVSSAVDLHETSLLTAVGYLALSLGASVAAAALGLAAGATLSRRGARRRP